MDRSRHSSLRGLKPWLSCSFQARVAVFARLVTIWHGIPRHAPSGPPECQTFSSLPPLCSSPTSFWWFACQSPGVRNPKWTESSHSFKFTGTLLVSSDGSTPHLGIRISMLAEHKVSGTGNTKCPNGSLGVMVTPLLSLDLWTRVFYLLG